jgi:hypothetical protein
MGELYLRKDEVPISKVNTFFMPVHPYLVLSKVHIEESIAQESFLKAVEEWWEEIQPMKAKYAYIHEKKPSINNIYGNYEFLGWESEAIPFDNGFIYCFSLAREDGSMIYKKEDLNCILPLKMNMKIDKDKQNQFINPLNHEIHAYTFHNLKSYPATLFLRDWSLNYMNDVFKKYL